ncbi:LysR family transcriptional regulator [Burkholderia multivorans]|uniref:LysR family transcriptional regulator n=1 Tax=Burkholderia multivorans TaxID=87883 RepID=A0AAP2MRC9_9BURK|nr:MULTISPECIES: LysR family transcriptional regulator [Burkholderia]MBH9663964.1 LysR family transcriptional regulator [Burkholderia multivorans]MBU9358983.1 LysR family transcriptional regulator [Burkholderia multivorans]MBU9362584.1 LysR family transcriptional regulator [Burkholderia multivorans]MBU9650202.1 LysR family transcriptional regulator [Burkholderia multivorans]MCA8482004.1 LysR family transcriptional regulator [Burkholderia multivorans]
MFDWENIRHFLAVARIGTLSGAARKLKVDHATVSRRLSALEGEVKTRLVERLPRACKLTSAGQRVFELAQGMEENAYAIQRFLDASLSPLTGKVTLSAPPVLVASFLVKHLRDFRLAHPGVQLSVSGEARQVSLSRREADIALRLVRPEEATSVVRKLGRMSFDLYASKDYPNLHDPSAWEFIVYDAGFADMPQQKWLMGVADGRPIACEISDITGHVAAARTGAGVAGLPCFLADLDPNLQRVPYDGQRFARDIWMAVHRDLWRSPQVRAVMDFLLKIVTENAAFTASS